MADDDETAAKVHWRSPEDLREERASSLADWHLLLVDRQQETEATHLLGRLAVHPALAGSEQTYLATLLAHRAGESERARELIGRCLDDLPGHERFRRTARHFGAS